MDGERLLEQVVALDPGYAPGWAYLGMTNSIAALMGYNGPFTPERLNEAIGQMEKSITLNPALPAAYLGLSFSYPYAGRTHEGVKAARRCLELGPSDAECMMFLAAALVWAGQPEEALRYAHRGIEANPLPPHYVHSFYGLTLWANRELPAALTASDECLRRVPGYFPCRINRLVALVEAGRLADAQADYEVLQRALPG